MEHLTLSVQQVGPLRTEEFMGREHRVFPAVLVRSQVLHNNLGATFLPADEIQQSADAWNGIPVVIRHPMRRGMPISARAPGVLNATGAGFLFNARAEGGALKADVYVDVDRARNVKDAGAVVANVEGGKVGEVSTGFATHIEPTKGTHDGEPYDAVMRGIRPDHLALLVEERGACSVDDGCGLGVNAGQEPGWIARLKQWVQEIVDRPVTGDSINEESNMERKTLIAQLAEAGPLDAETLAKLSDCQLNALAGNAEPEPEPEDEPAADDDLRREVAELRAELAAVKDVAAAANADREAEKTKLVGKLAANDRCAYDTDELKAKGLDELRKLDAMLRGVSYAGQGGPKGPSETATLTHMPVRPYWDTSPAKEA